MATPEQRSEMGAPAEGGAPRFILMLTRDDVTVPEARSLVPVIAAAGVRDVGAKDIGLPLAELQALFADLRQAGCTTYLEVVSLSAEEIVRSARSALAVGADYLIGGSETESVLSVIAGSGTRFFPYVGDVIGHPAVLRGEPDAIIDDALRVQELGVDGINLLAYRYDGDAEALVGNLVAAVRVPVIAAGSIDSDARIEAMRRAGVWGFTIGKAVLDGEFVPNAPLLDQLRHVLRVSGARTGEKSHV